MATVADEDRESPAGTVVMVLALATEVGGARGHTSLALLQTRQGCGGGGVRACECVPVCVCVHVAACVCVGSWLVDSPHTVQGARLVTRQALPRHSQDVRFCQK